jgi:hypothetical protein
MNKEKLKENCCTPEGQIKRYIDCKGCDRKPKQETLEEAAEKYAEKYYSKTFNQSSKMNKVIVNKRIGVTTSVVPHRNGTYPVWFKGSSRVEFINAKDVTFIKQ